MKLNYPPGACRQAAHVVLHGAGLETGKHGMPNLTAFRTRMAQREAVDAVLEAEGLA